MKKKNFFKKLIFSIFLALFLIIFIFILYEFATRNNTYSYGEKNLQIPIFVYHDIVSDISEVEHDYMHTPVDVFEKQISGLINLGYKPISYQDLADYKNGKIKINKWSFIITFDDGYDGVYDFAYPIAKKYNIPMTTFAIDSEVGKDGFFNWDEAKEMHDSGLISIYSHGYKHIEYDKVDSSVLLEETNLAYKNLKNKLNDNNLLKVFTYPYGLYNNEETDLLSKNGYIQNLTDNKINISSNLDLSKLHRCYPLNDSVFKIFVKIQYRAIKY